MTPDASLFSALVELGLLPERAATGAYLVHLSGRRRSPWVWLVAGEHALEVEAFVLHLGYGEDPAALHRGLLARNLRGRGVAFALDDIGDVYLVGSLPLSCLSTSAGATAAVDRLLGAVLSVIDEGWDSLLALAYADRLLVDPALRAKVLADGSGRRPVGTPEWAAQRDLRR